jgi:hypothetical protein
MATAIGGDSEGYVISTGDQLLSPHSV